MGEALPVAKRAGIPAEVQRRVKLDETCAYCGVLWASQIDHVIPVIQGGSRAEANLAHACLRCNSEKSGRTPAAWKAARLAAGRSWPPPNLQWTLNDIVRGLPEPDFLAIHRAVVADYPPLRQELFEIHDRYYAEQPRLVADDQVALLDFAAEYAAEVDV